MMQTKNSKVQPDWQKMAMAMLLACICSATLDAAARSNFLANGNGTVTHATTRLMWLSAPETTPRSYTQAVSFCSSLDFAEHDDWRLPRLKELLSLVDYKRFSPAVDPIAFAQMPNDTNLWAHSTFQNNTTAWFMNSFEGRIQKLGSSSSVSGSALTMCVRSAI